MAQLDVKTLVLALLLAAFTASASTPGTGSHRVYRRDAHANMLGNTYNHHHLLHKRAGEDEGANPSSIASGSAFSWVSGPWSPTSTSSSSSEYDSEPTQTDTRSIQSSTAQSDTSSSPAPVTRYTDQDTEERSVQSSTSNTDTQDDDSESENAPVYFINHF